VVRPIVTAWDVWLFDRVNVDFIPQNEGDDSVAQRKRNSDRDENKPPRSIAPDHALDSCGADDELHRDDLGGEGEREDEPFQVSENHTQITAPPAEDFRPEFVLNPPGRDFFLPVRRAWHALAGHHTMLLIDPSGLLKDNVWVEFLRSGVTGHARPQIANPLTWIASIVAFVWMTAVISVDGVRMAYVIRDRDNMVASVEKYIGEISNTYELEFPTPEIPSSSSVLIGLLVRIFILIAVFPFSVLSHHAVLLLPKRSMYLRKQHGPVHTAKVVGLIILILSFVVMIVGASVRAAKPWFSPHELLAAPFSAGSHPMSTLEDLHPLCREKVSDWTLIQLAGFPLLAEARTENHTAYKYLADRLGISLLEDDPDFGFYTTAVIAFDRTNGRLLLAPPAIPFTDNYGIYLEDSMANYYEAFIGEAVPLYGIASSLFLQNLLPGITEGLTTGILGPNRLIEHWLNNATLSVKQELEVVTDIISALGLSAARPSFVGHGANGLIVKAINLHTDTEPWRVAFESARLKDSPMETLSGTTMSDSTSSIINFYGEGSLFAYDEPAALTNHRLPIYPPASQLIPALHEFVPPDPFRTFCHIEAACGTDPVLDDMCDRAFPNGVFEEGMCQLYGRPRTRGKSEEETGA
jgi:hypothetical protein